MSYQQCEPLNPLGGENSDNEIGKIEAFMRTTAPEGYLACDGSSYSTDAYPKLVALFIQEFGTAYKFGGSGASFKVPDLRGEFLRGTGTNAHSYGGAGAAVGNHQNATRHAHLSSSGGDINAPGAGSVSAEEDWYNTVNNSMYFGRTGTYSSSGRVLTYTARPTNTSVLYCIRAY